MTEQSLIEESLIRRTLTNYWLALDERRLDEWIGLFCADGGFVVLGDPDGKNAALERATGPGELRVVADAMHNFEPGEHIGSDPLITVTGRTAEARSTVMFLTGRRDPVLRYVARCADVLEKVNDSWLFSKRIMTITLGVHEGEPGTD
jgi:hypothetical protein